MSTIAELTKTLRLTREWLVILGRSFDTGTMTKALVEIVDASLTLAELSPDEATLKTAVDALIEIAQLEDLGANEHLSRTGQWSGFAEPKSVKNARFALAKMRGL